MCHVACHVSSAVQQARSHVAATSAAAIGTVQPRSAASACAASSAVRLGETAHLRRPTNGLLPAQKRQGDRPTIGRRVAAHLRRFAGFRAGQGQMTKIPLAPLCYFGARQSRSAESSEARCGQKRHFDAGRWKSRAEKGFSLIKTQFCVTFSSFFDPKTADLQTAIAGASGGLST